MWRHTIIVSSVLVLIPVLGRALDCLPGTYAADGRTAEWAGCEGGCPAEWCERKTAEGYTFREGPFRAFYETGARYVVGAYDGVTRSGHWTVWYRSGRVDRHGAWKNFDKVGHWVVRSENGSKESDGRYVDGELRHGHWRFWDETGRLMREGWYDHGQPVGAWSHRDPFTDELISGELPLEPTGIVGPCGPRRLRNRIEWPPAPRLAFVRFTGSGDTVTAMLRIENPHDEPTCFFGIDSSPLAVVERWTGREWQDPPPSLMCGFGLTLVPLAARASVDFAVPLGGDHRPFRVRLSTSRPSYRLGSIVRTKRIDILN